MMAQLTRAEAPNEWWNDWQNYGDYRRDKHRHGTKEDKYLERYADFTDDRKPKKCGDDELAKLLVRVLNSSCPDPKIYCSSIIDCFYSDLLEGHSVPQGDSPMNHYDDVYQFRKPDKKWSQHLINRMLREVGDDV